MYILYLGYICGLILALPTLGDAAECGTNNKCVCANSIMDCRQKRLPKFPEKIDSDIKAVYLDHNEITDLSQIPEESELQTIVLTNNRIATLEFDAFDNLDNLKTLQLSNNSIKVIADDIFEWNPLKLEVLYLDGNKLEFIQHFLFYDLEQLTDLYLQNNHIVFIHPHAFLQLKSLRTLRLDGNQLHTFNHKWIDKLQANLFTELRFDNNPWSCDCAMNHSYTWLGKPKKSKWFHKLTKGHELTCKTPKGDGLGGTTLKEVNKTNAMSHCDMPKIIGISKPTTLRPTQSVQLRCVLADDRYPVSTISWTAPNKDVYRLNTAINYDGIEVDIDGSLLIRNLSAIDDGSYTCNASNYRGSHIATTTLTVKGQAPVKSSKHTEAVIIHSTATPDPERTVVPVKYCPSKCQCISRHIDCSGDGSNENRMPAIPLKIPEDAVTISLAGNELTSLKSSDFKLFKDLEELRLDDNKISSIDTHAFNHVGKLTTLTLQQNSLADIKDNTFSRLLKLNVLVLDRNELTKLRKKMFYGLKGLKWLYLRHNKIEQLKADTFDFLSEIKFIHMESNHLVTLPADTSFPPIAKLPGLTKMFLDDNNFDCNCTMNPIRKLIQDQTFQNDHEDFFGDGIICSSPSKLFQENLVDIKIELTCDEVAKSTKRNMFTRILGSAMPDWNFDDLGSPSKAVLVLGQHYFNSSHPLHFDISKEGPPSSTYSGLLFGGIAVGVILTFVIIVLWRK